MALGEDSTESKLDELYFLEPYITQAMIDRELATRNEKGELTSISRKILDESNSDVARFSIDSPAYNSIHRLLFLQDLENSSLEDYNSIINNIQTKITEEAETLPESLIDFYQGILDQWNNGGADLARQLLKEEKRAKNAQKKILNLELSSNYEEDFFTESSELFNLLQNQVFLNFENSGLGDISQYFTDNQENIETLIQNYSSFWNNLGEEQSLFKELLINSTNYTTDDYQNALDQFDFSGNEDLRTALISQAETSSEEIKNRYSQKLKQFGDEIFNSFEFLEEQIGAGLLDKITSQIDKARKISPQTITKLSEFYKNTVDENLGTEAEQIIANADLFSLTGYIDMLQKLKDKGIEVENIIPTVTEWFKEIPINLETELNSFAQNTSSKMKDMVESLDDAVSGMDFEDAVSFAQKMGLTLADLEQRDGQFFYDNLVEIKDYYFKEYDELKKAISAETERQKVAITNNSIFKGINENTKLEDIESLPEELKGLFTLYFDEWKNLELPEGEIKKDFASYVQNQLDESYTANVSVIDEYKQIMLSRFYVEIGNIENAIAEALTRVKLKDEQILPSVADIEAAIRAGDISGFAENVQTVISPLVGLINEAIKNSLTDTWNLVLDGFESPTGIITTDNKLIIEELEKLAPSGIVEKVGEGLYKIAEKINDSKLIKELETLSNGDYTKFNEYYSKIKSLQKYRGGGKDAKQEALGELIENADKLEEEALENIANDLGIKIHKLTKYLSQNADGAWIATASDIQEIIKKENIEIDNQLKDQLQERFNDIISMVSNGISGSASFQEIEIIQNYLNDAGQDIELKTFKTAEGLKLTEDSVYEIYYALSQIDAVAAQNLLEGISEQMEEWEGRGVDIATIYGKIGEAQKKIKNLEEKDPNDSRLRLAKAELATLQQIFFTG